LTDVQPTVTLTPEQQERADRFVQLLVATRTRMGGSRPASRRSLALQLDISPTMMNRYESGRIDPAEVRYGVILKLAQVLDVSLSAVAMYLLQGQARGLLEHPSMQSVTHLLSITPRAAAAAATAENGAWVSVLQEASGTQQANAALRLMQRVAVRMLDLGGASAGREALLDLMTMGLPARQQAKLRKQFEQQLVGLMMGQLPAEPDFWQAIAPALEAGGTPEALLQSLGLFEPAT